MTTVAGIVENGIVYMGGDSASSNGITIAVLANRKVFRTGEFLIGFAGSWRMGQALEYVWIIPESIGLDSMAFMVAQFVPSLRECLKAAECPMEEGDSFLVGFDGRLFRVDHLGVVAEPVYGFDAIGCGEEVALGALGATEGRPAERRIITALEQAERFTPGTRGPFYVESAVANNNMMEAA